MVYNLGELNARGIFVNHNNEKQTKIVRRKIGSRNDQLIRIKVISFPF